MFAQRHLLGEQQQWLGEPAACLNQLTDALTQALLEHPVAVMSPHAHSAAWQVCWWSLWVPTVPDTVLLAFCQSDGDHRPAKNCPASETTHQHSTEVGMWMKWWINKRQKHPDPSKLCWVKVDASKKGVGAILLQQPGVKHHWLERVLQPLLVFMIRTLITSAKRLNSSQACWAQFVARFEFTISHKSGLEKLETRLSSFYRNIKIMYSFSVAQFMGYDLAHWLRDRKHARGKNSHTVSSREVVCAHSSLRQAYYVGLCAT